MNRVDNVLNNKNNSNSDNKCFIILNRADTSQNNHDLYDSTIKLLYQLRAKSMGDGDFRSPPPTASRPLNRFW